MTVLASCKAASQLVPPLAFKSFTAVVKLSTEVVGVLLVPAVVAKLTNAISTVSFGFPSLPLYESNALASLSTAAFVACIFVAVLSYR